MNKSDADRMFADALSNQMVGVTDNLITEAANGNVETMIQIKKHILDIVNLGKSRGNPEEFYAAIMILAEATNKASELTEKWMNEHNTNT